MIKYFTLILLILVFGCAESQPQDVAEWKSISIGHDVFKSSYVRYVSTAPIKDTFENRKEYARVLLERKIISSLASGNRFDTLSTVVNAISRAQELSAVKYFIRSKVEPKISETTDTEIRSAFNRKNSVVNLQQIFAPTQKIAFEYYAELSQDSSLFDDLAQQSMIKAGESAQSYNMGWVRWNDMDLAPEIVAFELDKNEISEPVKSLRGWHIFKLVEKQETFFVDNSSFQNAKETLTAELERRKFEEESILYINSILDETPLELYPTNISAFWDYLEPQLPNSEDQLRQFLNSNPELGETVFDPNEVILAQLNGKKITANDFLLRLSTIPYWQLSQNLRTAVETISKDILFADMAKKADYYSHPEVEKETEIEKTRILYNTFTTFVSDTIKPGNYEGYWFSKHQKNYIKDQSLLIKKYSFNSEQEARSLLQSFKEFETWKKALAGRSDFNLSDSIQLRYSTNSDHPAFSINFIRDSTKVLKLWGPFLIDSKWSFVEILEKKNLIKSFEEAKPDLISDISANLHSLTHSILLERAEYDPSEIIYNTELLNNVLPYYSE